MTTGIRNDVRTDTRTDTRNRAEGNCAPSAPPPPPAAPPPQTLAQPDLDRAAAAQKQLGADCNSNAAPPPPAAAAPLNYDALLNDAPAATATATTPEGPPHETCPRGAAQAGVPPAAELSALSTSQQAVVDAGVAKFAAQNGMTIAQLAEQFDSNAAEIEALNPGLANELRASLGRLTADREINVPTGSSNAPPPAATPDPTTTQTYGARYGVPSPSMEHVRGGQATMGRGMGGESVADLQRRLVAAGADIAVDGKFGPRTEAALKAFQQANGIQQTGVLGRQTFASLENPQARRIPAASTTTGGSSTGGATSTAPTTSASNLNGTAFGNQLAQAAERSARSRNTVGHCAAGVSDALNRLGIPGRGDAYQKADQLARSNRFREVNVSASDLRNLPAGAVVVWGRSAAKPYGHVTVSLGNGMEASDHVQRMITGGRYGTDFGHGPDPQGRQFRVFLPQ